MFTMDKCHYKEVKDQSESVKSNHNKQWKPFSRQLLVCSGLWTASFMYGLYMGAPTVYIPQLRKEANNTSALSDDMASWLSSAESFSGFPFVVIVSIVTRFVGRKITFIIAVLDTFAVFLILYCSSNINHILIASIMEGFFGAAEIIITLLIVTEYSSPKYRAIFLTFNSATFMWGFSASNAIGTFFHWKIIPLVGIACALYTLLTMLVWPESPLWLASRGKFEECAAAHRWLKGCDEESEKELEALINSQKEYIASCDDTRRSAIKYITNFFRTITSQKFYKPTSLSIMTGSLKIFSGKLVFAVYAIDIIKKITNSESIAYRAMLILDGITVLSMYGGCILSKFLKSRVLLLSSATIAVIFLFVFSLYLYLINLGVIIENKYLSITLLVAFSVSISGGPLIMSKSVAGELLPIRSRNLSICFKAFVGKLVTALCIKLAPLVFKTFGLHGLFLSFGVCTSILILLLYKYLPETKDKTLQEIADSIKGIKSNNGQVSNLLVDEA